MNDFLDAKPAAWLRILQFPLTRLILLGGVLFYMMAQSSEYMAELSKTPLKAIAATAALALSACSRPAPPDEPVRAVKLVQVEAAGHTGSAEYAAVIQARTESRLGFRVGGQLLQRPAEVGQAVKAGQLLAVLDISALHSPPTKDSQTFALQLVKQYARMIEDAYFMRVYRERPILCFDGSREFVLINRRYLLALGDDAGLVVEVRLAGEQLGVVQAVHRGDVGRPQLGRGLAADVDAGVAGDAGEGGVTAEETPLRVLVDANPQINLVRPRIIPELLHQHQN